MPVDHDDRDCWNTDPIIGLGHAFQMKVMVHAYAGASLHAGPEHTES